MSCIWSDRGSSVKMKSVNTEEIENMDFTVINAEKGLVYDNDTKIVYYMLNTTRGGGNARYGFGYMSPFYSKNGELCKVVDGEIVDGEIVEVDK